MAYKSKAKRTPREQKQHDLGAIMTPPALVEKMLDMLPADTWTTPTHKLCEPACGTGNFIEGMAMRLMRGLEPLEADPVKRWEHIFANMIYAVDIQPQMVEHCIRRFGLEKLKHNIIVADFLKMDVDNWKP